MMAALGGLALAVETYEQVPYQSKPYRYATAARMAVIAHLFGMGPTDPRTARVLEIGCAGGGNLVPRALVNPGAEYLGIDPAQKHVAEAQQLIYALGLDNIRVEKRGVEELDEADGTFDYIIAHGVFSWVPEPVRRALLDACRRHLRPQGVAYVSYNTLPGWHMRGMVRDAMLFHVRGFTEPAERIHQARAMLQFLATAAPGDGGAWKQLLVGERELLDLLGDDYLFHDHLAPENEPVYVHQFVEQAEAAGLAYLGEAEFGEMMTLRLPPEARETIGRLAGDVVRAQQYMDFVLNRSFRQSLLVHREVSLERTIRWARVEDLWAGSDLTAPDGVDPTPGVSVTFANRVGGELSTSSPSLKAGWRVFAERFPEPVAFSDWLDAIRAALDAAGLASELVDAETIGRDLLYAYAQGLCELWVHPLELGGDEAVRPTSFPIARLQALSGAPIATTRRHEGFRLDALDRHLLALCDGTRDRTMLLEALLSALGAGDLVLEREGRNVAPEEATESVQDDLVARLHRFGRVGLLQPEAA